jgi:hypothetical protein
MLQYFLQAYHQGYRDGLSGRAASSPRSTMFDDQRTDSIHQSGLTSRPAYRAGLLEGSKSRTALSRTWPQSAQPVSPHTTIEEDADTLVIDYVQAAEFLHRVLQDVSEILQREPQNAGALVTARRHLQTVVAQVEPLGEDPGKAWSSLAMKQRWGYLRLVSFLGTAMHLLRQMGPDAAHTIDAVPAMRRSSYSS